MRQLDVASEGVRHLSLLQDLYYYIDSIVFINAYEISAALKSRYLDFVEIPLPSHYLPDAIELFSKCDHRFFVKALGKVATEEDHSILLHAISNFGIYLSSLFRLSVEFKQEQYCVTPGSEESLLFVIKGSFDLAHMSFAKSYYLGYLRSECKPVHPYFLFLDDKTPNLIDHCSFNVSSLPIYEKMVSLTKIIQKKLISTIVWPSVSQNLSLFLGSRFAHRQIYWSARYRNQLFHSVDKYLFGATSSKQNFLYNGVDWGHGRFYVSEWNKLKIITHKSSLAAKSDQVWEKFIKRKVAQGYVVAATISSSRKMRNSDFHSQVLKILHSNENLYYFYTSRDEECPLQDLLNSHHLSNRFKRIDWIHTMTPLLKSFDFIIDSYPVGSSHALCYALQASTPFISMVSQFNRESSLLNTIMPLVKNSTLSLSDIGLAITEQEFFEMSVRLSQKDALNDRNTLLKNQKSVIDQCLNNPVGMYEDFSEHILS